MLKQKNVIDYSGTAAPLMPLLEVSAVQLKPGKPLSNLNVFSSEKVSIMGALHHTDSVGVVVLQPDYFGFMWWDGHTDCRINGVPAERNAIYVQGAQEGFHAAGGARRTMGMALRRRDLVTTLAALRGVDPTDVSLNSEALRFSSEAASRFRAQIHSIFRRSDGCHRQDRGRSSWTSPGEIIFGTMIEAIQSGTPESRRHDTLRHPVSIVRKAEARFFAGQDEPISLADLCLAAGVSQSSLYRAFSIVCGCPPLTYFHKRRMTIARRALIESPASRGAVKRAALTAGLTEFGRFSVAYKSLFGESPSATLSKTP